MVLSPSVAAFLRTRSQRSSQRSSQRWRGTFSTYEVERGGRETNPPIVWTAEDARALVEWIQASPDDMKEFKFARHMLNRETLEIFCRMLQGQDKVERLSLVCGDPNTDHEVPAQVFLECFLASVSPQAELQELHLIPARHLDLSCLPGRVGCTLHTLELASSNVPIASVADEHDPLEVLRDCRQLRFLVITTSDRQLLHAALSSQLSLVELYLHVRQPDEDPTSLASFLDQLSVKIRTLLSHNWKLRKFHLCGPRSAGPPRPSDAYLRINVSALLFEAAEWSLLTLSLENLVLSGGDLPNGSVTTRIQSLQIFNCGTLPGSSSFFRQLQGLVDLRFSGTDPSGLMDADDWVHLLRNNPRLYFYDLEFRSWTNGVIQAFGAATSTRHPRLNNLHFAIHGVEQEDGWSECITSFVANYAWPEISIELRERLPPAMYQALANGLRSNTTLETLKFSYGDDLGSCFDAIRSHPSLKSLKLSFSQIRPLRGATPTLRSLAALLRTNSRLECFQAFYGSFGSSSGDVSELFQFQWPFLQSFGWRSGHMDPVYIPNLCNATKLRRLEISCSVRDEEMAKVLVDTIKKQGLICRWDALSTCGRHLVDYHLRLNGAGKIFFEASEPLTFLWPLLLERLTRPPAWQHRSANERFVAIERSVLYSLVKTMLPHLTVPSLGRKRDGAD